MGDVIHHIPGALRKEQCRMKHFCKIISSQNKYIVKKQQIFPFIEKCHRKIRHIWPQLTSVYSPIVFCIKFIDKGGAFSNIHRSV